MLKLIPPTAYSFDKPRLRQIKVSSYGLKGKDREEFVKVADGSLAAEFDNVSLSPGEVPVHLFALGSTETVGPNRNGDGFRNSVCADRHDTFVKHAKWYRNHKHTDPSKSYGIVKASTFNKDMGRIELIAALNGTKEAAERNGGLVADEELEKLASDKDIAVSMACFVNPDYPINVQHVGYVPISKVKVGDLVWTHKGRWREVTKVFTRNYSGTIYKFNFLDFPFSMELTAEHPIWVSSKGDLFNTPFHGWKKAEDILATDSFTYLKPDYTSNIVLENHELIEFAELLTFHSCTSLPLSLYAANEVDRFKFLAAWFGSCGVLYKNGAAWITGHPEMALQCRDLLASVGMPSAIKTTLLRANADSIGYEVFISDLNAARLKKHITKIPRVKEASLHLHTIRLTAAGTYLLKIKEINARHVDNTTVYNIAVAEDESFAAGGLLSHNCSVSHDICSSCGNKAPTRKQYCDESMCKHGGLKNNIGKVFEDGHILHADNPDPTFFDISHVIRPADRIAYVLGSDLSKLHKTAEDRVICGAELAEFGLGDFTKQAAAVSSMFENSTMNEQLAILNRLSLLETPTSVKLMKMAMAFAPSVTLSAQPLNLAFIKLSEMLASLAKKDCLLSVPSFLAMLSGDVKKAAELAPAIAKRLPGVFTRLVNDEDLTLRLMENPYIPGVCGCKRADDWVVKNILSTSLNDKLLVERLQKACLRCIKPAAPTLYKVAANTATEELAKQYALYQVGFLYSKCRDPGLPKLEEAILASNFAGSYYT